MCICVIFFFFFYWCIKILYTGKMHSDKSKLHQLNFLLLGYCLFLGTMYEHCVPCWIQSWALMQIKIPWPNKVQNIYNHNIYHACQMQKIFKWKFYDQWILCVRLQSLSFYLNLLYTSVMYSFTNIMHNWHFL